MQSTLVLGVAESLFQYSLVILVFLLVWRGLQDYLNSPLLMGRGMKLHPFAVILGVLITGEVLGMTGIFLSVPIMATLRIIWKNWKLRGEDIQTEAAASEPSIVAFR